MQENVRNKIVVEILASDVIVDLFDSVTKNKILTFKIWSFYISD